MVDSARRHGYFDPRWRREVAAERVPKGVLVSTRPPSTGRTGAQVASPAARLLLACARQDARVADGENEAGRLVEPVMTERGAHIPAVAFGWYEFRAARFSDARRHDLEALKAYETSRLGSGREPVATKQ